MSENNIFFFDTGAVVSIFKSKIYRVWQQADDDVVRVQMIERGDINLFKHKCRIYVFDPTDKNGL